MGSGLPQFGFPRRFAIDLVSLEKGVIYADILGNGWGEPVYPEVLPAFYLKGFFFKNQQKNDRLPTNS